MLEAGQGVDDEVWGEGRDAAAAVERALDQGEGQRAGQQQRELHLPHGVHQTSR